MESKRLAAVEAVKEIEDGMVVGLGTGSTAYYAIVEIGRRVAEGLRIRAVATSVQSEELAVSLHIPIVPFAEIETIDVTIDGADEADGELHLIKGGGGALLREKIVAASSKRLIIIADASKVVERLGKFPLPVEIVPFAYELTLRKLAALGCEPVIRQKDGGAFRTDNGNLIVDCHFGAIEHVKALGLALHGIPGVVEHGLFIGMADKLFVGQEDGAIRELAPAR
ncbi:ribose-5-phosphate isomerase RpiA [Paenibacillus methanolicus]|uniref:Ribose-5-phosphate isomerase A n=1 Tax=Paenibacillus methanolicus TaxID=582686 RepID=A0A5S5CLB9_9BACL|nr:ribose-5-phosphate isomerase RpiA [Paenibacillus methanolicus]TYP79753.1 ribose 5-phosphate isomerase A [Paenibacillus methanolicus]